MNAPIRKLSVVALTMILTAMIGASWVQFVQADSLNNDDRNVRTLFREYGGFRGPIIVDGEAVAYSVPVDDSFTYQRTYMDGELYAHVTGYFSIVGGRTGIEKAENTLLSGSSDALFWSRLGDLLAGREQEGASVELTLRADLQRLAADALGDQRGAIVALDPRTGEILAMVSTPSYDPANLAAHSTSAVNRAFDVLSQDLGEPLTNRAIGGDTYAPGSLFKLVTTAAALEQGFTPDSLVAAPQVLELPNSTSTISNFRDAECDEGSDTTTLAHALAESCNTAFAALGMSLGWVTIERKAREFGWEKPLDIPLTVTPSRLPSNPDAPQTAISSIGQYDVRATPLQMAMVVSAIANDGVLMEPHLISQVRAPDLRVLSVAEPRVFSQPLSTEDAGYLREMMTLTVNRGTGVAARIDGVAVGGKTGTAETGSSSAPHAWFAGFAPANDPAVVVVVLVENGGRDGINATGGSTAAPLAVPIIERALELEAKRAAEGLG